jgi:RNA polymerase sigma-70 factor, ECF subfamily
MAVNIRHGPGSNAQEVTLQTAHQPGQLITRCIRGEDQAWRDLHRGYYPVAFRFLRRMGITASELDDACQEVFVQVFRYLARFQQRAEFQTWLYKLCVSQASRVRRRRRMHAALDWLLGRGDTPQTGQGEPEWSDSQKAQRVRQVLDRMKPMHKEVFVLFELEGVDGQEIARILGCRAATVRRRLHYARQEFESLLRAETVEEDNP